LLLCVIIVVVPSGLPAHDAKQGHGVGVGVASLLVLWMKHDTTRQDTNQERR
jgi:hypothetical protein